MARERRLVAVSRVQGVLVQRKGLRLVLRHGIGKEVKRRHQRPPDVHLALGDAADLGVGADGVAKRHIVGEEVAVRDAPRVEIKDGVGEVGGQAELGLELGLKVGTDEEVGEGAQVVEGILGEVLKGDGVEGFGELVDEAEAGVVHVLKVAQQPWQAGPRGRYARRLGLETGRQFPKAVHGRGDARHGVDGVKGGVFEQERRVRLLAAKALHQGGIGLAIHKDDVAAFPLGQLRHGHGLHRPEVGEGGGIDLLGRLYPRRLKGAEVLGRRGRLGQPLADGGGRLGVGRAGSRQVVEGVDGRGQVADEVFEARLVPHDQLDLLAPPGGLLGVDALAGQATGAVPEGLGLGQDVLDGGHDAADDLAQAGLVERGVDEQLGRGLLGGVGPLEAPADEAVLLDAQLSVEGLDLGVRVDALDGVLDEVGRLFGIVVEPAQAALDAEGPAGGEGHDGFHGGRRGPGRSRLGESALVSGWALGPEGSGERGPGTGAGNCDAGPGGGRSPLFTRG